MCTPPAPSVDDSLVPPPDLLHISTSYSGEPPSSTHSRDSTPAPPRGPSHQDPDALHTELANLRIQHQSISCDADHLWAQIRMPDLPPLWVEIGQLQHRYQTYFLRAVNLDMRVRLFFNLVRVEGEEGEERSRELLRRRVLLVRMRRFKYDVDTLRAKVRSVEGRYKFILGML